MYSSLRLMLHNIHDSGEMSIEYRKGFSTTHLDLVILTYVIRIIIFFLTSVSLVPRSSRNHALHEPTSFPKTHTARSRILAISTHAPHYKQYDTPTTPFGASPKSFLWHKS